MLCSEHHPCPTAWGCRPTGPQDSSSTRVKRSLERREGDIHCCGWLQSSRYLHMDTGSSPPIGEGAEPCCSLTEGISSLLLATTSSSKTRAMMPNTAGSTSLPQGRANTGRGRAELALLAAPRASKAAPFAMAVPSSARTTTQVMAGGLVWIGGTLQPPQKHGTKLGAGERTHPAPRMLHLWVCRTQQQQGTAPLQLISEHKGSLTTITGTGHREPETKHAAHWLPVPRGRDSPAGTQGVGCTHPGSAEPP